MNFTEYSRKYVHYYHAQLPSLLATWFMEQAEVLELVVDVGCGDGAIINALPSFPNVLGTDLSFERLTRLRNRISSVWGIQSDGCYLPLRSSTVALIICNQVIEHIPDDMLLLREIWRVLDSKKWLFLSSVIKRPYGWYIYKNAKGERVHDPTHVREYRSDRELLDLVVRADFQIIRYETKPSQFPLGDLIMRLLVKLNLLDAERSISLSERSHLLGLLNKVHFSPIGYDSIEIVARKHEP